ncbi:AAA family ATPase [Vibrio vulnificus]
MAPKVSKITIKNYRAFRNEHRIAINSLTLFFGYNNTGKSALIRLFPLLKDSFSSTKVNCFTNSYLDYSSSSIRGSLFQQLATQNERKLSFGVNWDSGDMLSFSLTQEGLSSEVMNSLSIKIGQNSLEYHPSIDDTSMLENKEDQTDQVSFYNFRLPHNEPFNELITSLSNSVHWISSIRNHPPRKFEIGIGVPLELKPNGDGIGPLIWHLAETQSESIHDINQWLKNSCGSILNFADDKGSVDGRKFVALETIHDVPNEYQDQEKAIRTPILDSGEGIAQALPVVTLCAMAANGELGENPIIAIEQPELHLHPHATVELAKFLILCIQKNKSVRYILETHSESFLRAMQIAIVDQSIEASDISCYWVDKNETTSTPHLVTFDNEGFITGSWPQGVFRETLNQSKELVQLRKSKGSS